MCDCDENQEVCPTCEGLGYVVHEYFQDGESTIDESIKEECSSCYGTGCIDV